MKTNRRVARVHDHVDAHFDAHVERCRALLRQPSVSATGQGVAETAAMVGQRLAELGSEVRLEGDPAAPIVFATLRTGLPVHLVVYGMYDVQPVDAQRWTSPPFAAEIRTHRRHGPCIYARGAVNSKGALAGLLNTLESIRAADRLPVDLTFVIEGQEEIGSPQLEAFIETHRDALRGVGVADFDFSEDATGGVALHLGLKGIVYAELRCVGGGRTTGGSTEPQHSSAGAWIASPAWRLVHALSTLVDDRERITIEGMCGRVAPVSRRDRHLLRRLAADFDEAAFLREMKAVGFKHRIHGVELLERGLFSPVVNIDGIHSGYAGPGSKTILPRVATARIDIRFGPHLEPDEVVSLLQRHLDREGFGDIEVRVREGYTWSKTDADEPLVRHLVDAYRLHGKAPQVWPMATWTAPYHVFSRLLGLPVVAGGLGYGDRAHSPDEFMTVEGLRRFEKWVATFLYQLAR